MNLIVIKSAVVGNKTVRSKTGAMLNFREQTAAIETGTDFPMPFKITLSDDQEAYAPGRYLVDPASYEVDRYGNLAFGRRVILLPLPTPAAQVAKAS